MVDKKKAKKGNEEVDESTTKLAQRYPFYCGKNDVKICASFMEKLPKKDDKKKDKDSSEHIEKVIQI